MTIDEFFEGWDESKRIFGALREAVAALGPVELYSASDINKEAYRWLEEAWSHAK
ncbi:MAG: hypothetical protein ACM3WU_06310 [Bacillota bacterium]